MNALDTASLNSSVHIVCRPRENPDGSLSTDEVGDWRDVLQELPPRIHAWLPRLAQEGVVGADAIFACLGPALEIFSRYSRVEKASGEPVLLKEYLEQVWAAVSKEALGMVFAGADASALEEDARLTAMWLWTLSRKDEGGGLKDEAEDEEGDEETGGSSSLQPSSFSLEYDAARKIAQGLGAYLEKLDHLVEIKGSTARLRAVSERTRYLFGQDGVEAASRPVRKRQQQMSLFDKDEGGGLKDESVRLNDDFDSSFILHPSSFTILDRVHQSMLLFAAGRSDALKRFLVDEGVGQNTRFWQLANALSALYPPGTDEKRWVEGVLARKKGLGF
jgi:putative DNA methylase